MSFALIIMLWFGVSPLKPYFYPNNDIGWVKNLYIIKERDLALIDGPRTIFVGGSSVHFGVDAKAISERLNISAFNFGSHAGLQIPYLMDRVSRVSRAGDTVVLMIEYPLLRNEHPYSYLSTFYSSFEDKTYWTRIPPSLYLDYVMEYDIALLWKAVRDNLLNWRFSPLGLIPGPYDAKNIDGYGVERGNLAAKVTPSMRARVAADNQIFPRLDTSAVPVKMLIDFVLDQKAKGVRVLAAWPPTLRRPEHDSQQAENLFSELRMFWLGYNIPIIGTPQQMMVGPEDVYDTTYHMNEKGMRVITEAIIVGISTLP